MEGQKPVGPCKFDIFFTKSVPHILENIFFSLDYETFNTCLLVSTKWRVLLTSESYLKEAISVFRLEDKLWQAAKEGNMEEVRSISSNIFVDLNCEKGPNMTTPLWEVSHNIYIYRSVPLGHKDVIQFLLERGVNPDWADVDGRTPLHHAALRDSTDVAQLLLNRGANANSTSLGGWTPLHGAAAGGRKDMVELLLNAGAEPNMASESGLTPLLLAHRHLYKDNLDIVNMLKDALKKQQL